MGQPIDWLWTPGKFANSEASATDHFYRHATVNGVTHASLDTYIQAAWDFVAANDKSKAPQNKNPRVLLFHNADANSTSATLAVMNNEPTHNDWMKCRMASFYDINLNRNEDRGKTVQQVIADLVGIEVGILFPSQLFMTSEKPKRKKFGDL